MADVLALIPARAGSKGVPNKNFRELAGLSPMYRAIRVCGSASVVNGPVIVSSDDDPHFVPAPYEQRLRWLKRPAELAQDDTPMIDVVKHALAEIPGPPEQIILLIQPTQPLRQPKHLRAAIELLESSGADSVVSVVELPLSLSPDVLCEIAPSGQLMGWNDLIWAQPTRRQDARPAYQRDGTVYAFRRATVTEYNSIYGCDCRPLIIPPEETCALDTPADWAEAERRLHERER